MSTSKKKESTITLCKMWLSAPDYRLFVPRINLLATKKTISYLESIYSKWVKVSDLGVICSKTQFVKTVIDNSWLSYEIKLDKKDISDLPEKELSLVLAIENRFKNENFEDTTTNKLLSVKLDLQKLDITI